MYISIIINNILWITAFLSVPSTTDKITLLNDHAATPYNLIIVIASQSYEYHAKMADENKRSIQYQALLLNRHFPRIHVSYRDFPNCYLPALRLLSKLWQAYADMNNTWIFIIEENTQVNLKRVYRILDKYNANEEFWIGYILRTSNYGFIVGPTCQSNPDGLNIDYPNAASGVAMTTKLLKRISTTLDFSTMSDACFWTIWSAYRYKDMAYFIWRRGHRRHVVQEPAFCLQNSTDCASYPLEFAPCGQPVMVKHLYFAVGTCQKFHGTRIPIVKNTWTRFAKNVRYFSDKRDDDVPTIQLNYPVQQTGFCEKSHEMLKYIKKDLPGLPDVQWVVLLDDDTTISVYRIRELLSCYDHRQTLAIGEMMFCSYNYNYLTGGAGRLLSRALVEKWDPEVCKCPPHRFAEDWHMGMCFTEMNFTMIASPKFHTLEPNMYHDAILKEAVTFHDGRTEILLKAYTDWLSFDDFSHSSRPFEV